MEDDWRESDWRMVREIGIYRALFSLLAIFFDKLGKLRRQLGWMVNKIELYSIQLSV